MKCTRCKGEIEFKKETWRKCKVYCLFCFSMSKREDKEHRKPQSKFMLDLIKRYGKHEKQ